MAGLIEKRGDCLTKKWIVGIASVMMALIGMHACGTSTKVTTEQHVEVATTGKSVPQIGVLKIDESDSLFATLSHGYCFGMCPVYTVSIFQSGFTLYEGKANVDMIGDFIGNISQESIQIIRTLAENINYVAMDTLYHEPKIADFPTVTTSIVLNHQRKRIRNVLGSPPELVQLERTIDSLVASISWQQKKNDK